MSGGLGFVPQEPAHQGLTCKNGAGSSGHDGRVLWSWRSDNGRQYSE